MIFTLGNLSSITCTQKNWSECFKWLKENLEAVHNVFAQIIKTI